MILKGTVLAVENVSGSNDGQAYSYFRAHVLDGIEVRRCKVGDAFGQVGTGESIVAEVATNVYTNRGQAALSLTLVKRIDLDALIAA